MVVVLALLAALAVPKVETVALFDLEAHLAGLPDDSALRYDTVKLVGALQGLANREAPRLLIRFHRGPDHTGATISLDDYWRERLRQTWLKDAVLEPVDSLEALLERFPEARHGVVLWDESVPATANVASTVCGVEGWLPVRAGGELHRRLVEGGPKLPVRLSLAGRFDGSESTSPKCDAYLWAKREYLDTGRCSSTLMAYYLDGYTHEPGQPGPRYTDLANAGLVNADYYVARKAFFFDLGPWADEAPVDDPGQAPGTDRRTLEALLRAAHARNGGEAFVTVGGFVPWNLKYTNFGPAGGRRDPVPAEWEYAAVLSAHDAIMDADALGLVCLTNASFYGHHPLAERYEQNPRPERRPLETKTYALIYMGDYDSAAWLSTHIPSVWDDPDRGSLPLAWAFNPNLADRVPHVFDHVYRTRTAHDWFMAGEGAGYNNPNLLVGDRLGSGLPDALDLWTRHSERWYRRFDMRITGFVINGFHGDMPERIQKAYARFSPDGVGMQLGYASPLVDGTPFLRHVADIYPDPRNVDPAVDQMASTARPGETRFLIFRMILQKPSTVRAVRDRLLEKYPEQAWEFCDPYTFFDLYKRSIALVP